MALMGLSESGAIVRIRHRWRCWRERIDLYSRERWTNAQYEEFEGALLGGVILVALMMLIFTRIGR